MESPGYVYVITDGRYYEFPGGILERAIKIGKTDQYYSRFLGLQNEQSFLNSQFKILLLVKLENKSSMTSLETTLHREFKERRIISSKEWFYMNDVDEIVQYIENIFSLQTNVTIYKSQEEINDIYKKMNDYMNSPLKNGKNPEQQKSGLKVKKRVLYIQSLIRQNEYITPNQLIEQLDDYNKADLRYDIQNGYFTF
jgi:hypothetical protein